MRGELLHQCLAPTRCSKATKVIILMPQDDPPFSVFPSIPPSLPDILCKYSKYKDHSVRAASCTVWRQRAGLEDPLGLFGSGV